MRLDPISTLEGRNLALAYAAVIVLQGGYFLWLLKTWLRGEKEDVTREKSTRPV